MRRQSTNAESGDDLSEEDGTAYAESVAVEHHDHTRVHVSGMTSEEPHDDVGEQTRDILERIEGAVERAGGEMSDVVRVRVYVVESHLSQSEFEAIHAARREFFDPGTYPASTLVEVAGLIREDRLIEIDADAVIPHDGWD